MLGVRVINTYNVVLDTCIWLSIVMYILIHGSFDLRNLLLAELYLCICSVFHCYGEIVD